MSSKQSVASNTGSDEERKCLGCGKQERDCDGGILRCGQCQSASYCSRACQAAHWKAGHKRECGPPIVDEFWKFVEKSKQDFAITEDEQKWMKWAVLRMAGHLNTDKHANSGDSPEENMRMAVLHRLDYRLLAKGRGVRLVNLSKSKKQDEGSIAYIVRAIGGRAGPSRTYQVRLENGTTIKLRLHQMHMLPLNDLRHWKSALEFKADPDPDEVFPPSADAGWCNLQRQHVPIPEEIKWEYLDNDGEWKEYSECVRYGAESLWRIGAEHYLYTPGAPHCEGMPLHIDRYSSIDLDLPFAGNENFLIPHDASSRQIVFSEDGTQFTERDLFTGMRRPVRRSGPPAPPELNGLERRGFYGEAYHFKDNSKNTGTFCGLCESTTGPFMQTPCCNNWVCDTEDQYEVGSYEREGQCARNHRYGSICGFHHQEGHTGDWKDCQECVASFHPYDYAVMASSQAKSCTVRRYNFDNNVRHDSDFSQIEFPTCHECQAPVNTTEETTRTLMLRRMTNTEGRNFCKYHGGGFGIVAVDPSFYDQAGRA